MDIQKKKPPYGSVKYSSIDEYHASFPQPVQEILEQVRQAIKAAAPNATETISYNMPAFKMDKTLVYYAANKAHLGFYPTPSPLETFKEELKNYKTSKGAVQFPYDQPLPLALIKKMVRARVKEEKEKMK